MELDTHITRRRALELVAGAAAAPLLPSRPSAAQQALRLEDLFAIDDTRFKNFVAQPSYVLHVHIVQAGPVRGLLPPYLPETSFPGKSIPDGRRAPWKPPATDGAINLT